ncbi:histone-lysine N-methyltransferase 2B-like isoform X2 [Dysidea avara]|uniref:histone-lysine N-methyltransferase 2B-like isoform X2 n=1 Tax=Dysidea avara TaxID=196820 RepID=UPI00332D31D4
MPKVKLPTVNPSKKAGSSKKATSSSGKDSSPAKDVSCVAKISDLLTDASAMLHREDDMSAPFLGFKPEEVLSQRRKLQGSLKQLGVEHKRKSDTPLKSIASVPSSSAATDAAVEIDASINDSITEDITDKDLSINKDGGSAKEVCKSHKKKEDGSAKKSSGKRKKERHSGPMAKKHKVDSDSSPPLVVPTVEGDEAPPLVVPTVEGDEDSMDTMQTRMRTGTISKNTLAHLSGVMDGSDQESMGSRPLSPNWEEEPADSGSESKIPSGRSKGGGGKMCKRRGRCMECPNCLKKDDCGQCPNCLDKPKFGGPNTRKQACIQRKCHFLMIRERRKGGESGSSSASKQSKKQPRPPKEEEAGLVQTRPHPIATSRAAALMQRRTTRRIKGKSAVQLRWQHISSDGMTVYWRRGQQAHVIPLCAHCGSAGVSELMRCQICCVPYHWYCLKDYCHGDDSQKSFICSSCIGCAVCGRNGNVWQCSRCDEYYHIECLPEHTPTPTRATRHSWRCITCNICSSCKNSCSDEMFNHTPSNTPDQPPLQFCATCFKLFSDGNYCPICYECYSDSDYESKMVQCGRCDHWVHSHCEQMTDEEYEVLSELPEESVMFLCCLCSEEKDWREAIYQHCSGVFQQIMNNLQNLSVAKILFKPTERGGVPNNGRNVDRTSLVPMLERVANGYYKTVDEFSNALLLAMMSLLHCEQDQSLYKTVIAAWGQFTKLMGEHFAWYHVKEITNLSDVSALLMKEYGSGSHGDVTPGDERQQWFTSLPADHSYHVKDVPRLDDESSHDPPLCDKVTDLRKCLLCSQSGDHSEKSAGRLIPCGIGEWVHVNCALWSAEVYEEQSGMMYDVHTAISRGSRVRCDVCHDLGATIGCCAGRCSRSFHFLCALSADCIFLANKNLFCPEHASSCEDQPKATEEQLQVSRCVVVDMLPERHYVRLVESIDPEQLSTQIGCTLVHEAGEIIPQSETSTCLLPSKYRCSFQFWDVNNPVAMTTYTLTVRRNDEAPQVYLSSWAHPSPGGDVDNPTIDYECVTVGAPPQPDMHTDRLSHGVDTILSQVTSQRQRQLEAQLVGGALEGLMSLAGDSSLLDRIKLFNMAAAAPAEPSTGCTAPITSEELKSPCLDKLQLQKPATPHLLELHLSSSSGYSAHSATIPELWSELISKLQQQRSAIGLDRIAVDNISPFKVFGVSLESVVRIIEQLPEAENCTLYQFQHHPPSKLSSWYDAKKRETINQTGCARSEPYRGRQPWDMFNFLMSEYRPKPPAVNHEDLAMAEQEGLITNKQVFSAASTLPMAMRYRNLRKKVKHTVGVYKSSIHGMGLFCKLPIDPFEMVIEYSGTVIRSTLTDKREDYYNSKNIGCYMFRIDEHEVVDATMSGNAARFINHSCEPNCYSKIITVDGRKKIIIFARRRIVPGEELTYDYKFPIEDASAKIPCCCGAANCRGTMN